MDGLGRNAILVVSVHLYLIRNFTRSWKFTWFPAGRFSVLVEIVEKVK